MGDKLGILGTNLSIFGTNLASLGNSSSLAQFGHLGHLGRQLLNSTDHLELLGLDVKKHSPHRREPINPACYTKDATKLLVQFDMPCYVAG